MEQKQKSKRKSDPKSAEQVRDRYIEYLLTEGKAPVSVFKFCLENKLSEDEFYKVAGSFEGLDRLIWRQLIESVVNQLRADKAFSEFTAREQVLSFYFALFERLKAQRSYAVYHLNQQKLEIIPGYLKDFKKVFSDFFNGCLNEAQGKGEVAKRPFVTKHYPQLFWMHFGFLLHFWKEDNSAGFEQTDAAIEKSVNLAFELIGNGALDTGIDFAKFLYQSKMN